MVCSVHVFEKIESNLVLSPPPGVRAEMVHNFICIFPLRFIHRKTVVETGRVVPIDEIFWAWELIT